MIISVFGSAGAGKTSLVIDLARQLANNGLFVGIVSAETRLGTLQRELGGKVEEGKSLKQAILDSGNVKKYAVMYTQNIYYYSMADQDDITSHVVDDMGLIEKFISEVNKKFDILIADCTDRATDDLTAAFLKRADKIINLIESTPKGIAFFNAHHPLRESFYDPQKELIVLNKNIATNLNRDTAQSLIAHRINLVIPYFPTFYEDQLEQRSNKKYSKCIADLMRLVISNDQDTTIEKVNKKKFGIKAAISIKKEKVQ